MVSLTHHFSMKTDLFLEEFSDSQPSRNEPWCQIPSCHNGKSLISFVVFSFFVVWRFVFTFHIFVTKVGSCSHILGVGFYCIGCFNAVDLGLVMSQSRSRKAQNFGGESSGRVRSSVVRESGDAAHSVHHQNQPKTKQNNRTKNKIPKSMRYDLDNALVSVSALILFDLVIALMIKTCVFESLFIDIQ